MALTVVTVACTAENAVVVIMVVAIKFVTDVFRATTSVNEDTPVTLNNPINPPLARKYPVMDALEIVVLSKKVNAPAVTVNAWFAETVLPDNAQNSAVPSINVCVMLPVNTTNCAVRVFETVELVDCNAKASTTLETERTAAEMSVVSKDPDTMLVPTTNSVIDAFVTENSERTSRDEETVMTPKMPLMASTPLEKVACVPAMFKTSKLLETVASVTERAPSMSTFPEMDALVNVMFTPVIQPGTNKLVAERTATSI